MKIPIGNDCKSKNPQISQRKVRQEMTANLNYRCGEDAKKGDRNGVYIPQAKKRLQNSLLKTPIMRKFYNVPRED